jgi:hypothetical protein
LPDVVVFCEWVPSEFNVHVPLTCSDPVTGTDEQPILNNDTSSSPVTFRHDGVAVQVPIASPPQGVTFVTLSQDAGAAPLPELPDEPPLALKPPLPLEPLVALKPPLPPEPPVVLKPPLPALPDDVFSPHATVTAPSETAKDASTIKRILFIVKSPVAIRTRWAGGCRRE